MEVMGLEPTTSTLQRSHSSQLSYTPMRRRTAVRQNGIDMHGRTVIHPRRRGKAYTAIGWLQGLRGTVSLGGTPATGDRVP